MSVLENLGPEKVYQYFEEICNIPHGSTNLDRISSYLAKFASDRGLWHVRDASNNVIIIKEATPGYEEVEPIILQGHMDMVAVKKSDCDIDLWNDPLRLKVDGDYIFAEGTSLGGDDGIAVAYALAILDSDDIKHPRLEVVITTDEEIGMEGATAIDLSMLKAKRMLNIDSEEEGILLTSCAGGLRADCKIPIQREQKAGQFWRIEVGGLTGGHSGAEINKERGNAIKLLARVLGTVQESAELQIADICGGEKDNAIPREACAIVSVSEQAAEVLVDKIHELDIMLKNEHQTKEKNLYVRVSEPVKEEKSVLTVDSTNKVIAFLMALPNGIMNMSMDIVGLVETSLNVGVLELKEDMLVSKSALRSSIETAKQYLLKQVENVAKLVGGSIETSGDYPGWQFNPDSKLRAQMIEVYKEMFHKEPQVEALHAGLECGIMIAKIPGLDCVSFGPDILDIHTTEERLSISSTNRMWEYLLAILACK